MTDKGELEEYLQLEKETAETYFAAHVDFIKWTTTIAIAATLWVSSALADLNGTALTLTIMSLAFILLAIVLAILAFKAGVDRAAHFWDIARLNWSRALLDAFEAKGASEEFVQRKRKEITERFDRLSSAGDRLSGSKHFQSMAAWHIGAIAIAAGLYAAGQICAAISSRSASTHFQIEDLCCLEQCRL